MRRREFGLGAVVMSVALAIAAGGSGCDRRRSAGGRQPQGIALKDSAQADAAFKFVVVGDTRPGRRVYPTDDRASVSIDYLENILWINRTEHDLSVNVGDIISGYNKEDPDLTIRQWENYDRAALGLRKPCFMVVGNHDVWDEQSAEIYTKRYGPLYYSFDHKGVHFTCLSSEVPEEANSIGDGQLAWLEEDLQQAQDARHRFVFLHRPMWTQRRGADAEGWMGRVHSLLLKYEVDTVFAGHDHYYQFEEIDGIRYIISGGGGAELRGHRLAGGFFHFLSVSVPEQGAPVITVMEKDEAMPQDVVTRKQAEAIRKLTGGPVFADAAMRGETTKLVLRFVNETELAAEYDLQWTAISDPGTKVKPLAATLKVRAGKTKLLSFKLALPPEPSVIPVLTWTAKINGGEIDGKTQLAVARRGRYVVGAGFVPSAAIMKIHSKGQIGYGKPANWKGVQDSSSRAWLKKETGGLRFRAEVTDDVLVAEGKNAWENDSVELYFDLRSPAKRGRNTKEPGWFQLIVVPWFGKEITNSAIIFQQGRKVKDAFPGMTVESGKMGKGYWLEVFIPLDGITRLHGELPREFFFDYSVNDVDSGTTLKTQMPWSGAISNYMKPHLWGRMKPVRR